MALKQYRNPSVIETGTEFHAVAQGGVTEADLPVHVYMCYIGPAATSRCEIEPATAQLVADFAWNDNRHVYIGEAVTVKEDRRLAEAWDYWTCRMLRRWDEGAL